MSLSLPSEWPADAVARVPVASLTPHARNARTHDAAQVRQLAESIREWGWTVPVLVDEHGVLIAGHGRVLAAQSLGILEVPAMVARGWSDARKRAYVLADNKLALNAGWDAELLRAELLDLHGMGAADLTGFAPGELKELLFPDAPTPPSAERALSDSLSYQVVVECDGEAAQAGLIEQLRAQGLTCRPLIL